MATIAAPEAKRDKAGPAKGSLLPLIGLVLLLTCCAVGAGCAVIFLLDTPSASGSGSAGADVQSTGGRTVDGGNLRALPTVTTNLGPPGSAWIRLEASVLLDGDFKEDGNVLTAKIAEDVVAYLRTVSLAQIEGGSGLLHLREDLKDRIRVRSGGKAKDLIIQALVIE